MISDKMKAKIQAIENSTDSAQGYVALQYTNQTENWKHIWKLTQHTRLSEVCVFGGFYDHTSIFLDHDL